MYKTYLFCRDIITAILRVLQPWYLLLKQIFKLKLTDGILQFYINICQFLCGDSVQEPVMFMEIAKFPQEPVSSKTLPFCDPWVLVSLFFWMPVLKRKILDKG